MSHRTTSRDLDEIFGKYGRIDNINVIKDHVTGESRGFAFIYYSDIEDAKRAREKLNGEEIHGRNIRTDYSISKQGHPTNRSSSRYDREPRGERRRRCLNFFLKLDYSRSRSRGRR
ncbi:transformer 2 beta [Bonamia ostreae]|uniref:Transformer 2 beta n=1 Tax=Bonamia ostreae TaxID=126728 RepID=A0ABV2ATI1_9EUKA